MVENRSSNLLDRLLSAPNDSPQKAIFVILAVCLFASVLVTTSSVLLRPLQQENAERARAAQLAGVLTGESEAVEPTIKALVIVLETGLPDETLDPATFLPLVTQALAEDHAERDLTALALLPADRVIVADIITRQSGESSLMRA